MKRLTRREAGFCTVVVLAVAIALIVWTRSQGKSSSRAFQQATVVLQGPPRQMKQVTDPKEMQRLASFFPGFDRGRRSDRFGAWERAVDISFVRADGSVVEVTVSYELDTWTWGQGRGDLPVEGDLAGFLSELFPEAPQE